MDSKRIVETIRSGVSGIHIQAQDLLRVDEEINVIADQLKFKVCEWNWGYGWVDFQNKHRLKQERDISFYEDLETVADENLKDRLYIIKNAYSVLKDDPRAVARLQQELLRIKRYFNGNSAILLIAKENIDFSDISDLIVTFQCPPLAYKQVDETIRIFLKENSISMGTEVKTTLTSTCSGMERDMVDRVLKTLKNSYGNCIPNIAVDDALTIKKGLLSQSGLLELIDSKISIDQIGGLEQLKSWLRNKKRIIDDLPEAERLGIAAPKGALLAGMPGCGKSMSAKAAASLFKVPLLRLDIGTLMGKFVGESEANMKAALKLAEKASPCVLWIDELEKAFSGINGSGGSTEITTRLFGYFLTWMQEKPGAVFVVATANDITTIPPELLRRGRFDEIFYINLPEVHERKQIFEVKTQQLSLSSQGLDCEALAENTDGFSGADIECVINDALEDLFRRKKALLTQEDLKRHIKLVTPISAVLEEKIEDYRKLFEKFKLKSASFAKEDFEMMDAKFDSNDASERENAASSDGLSDQKLMRLIKDDDSDVRKAVLKNPKCPVEALKQIVDNYEPFDFSKPGQWNVGEVSKEEFELALHHPNMSGEIIVDLYKKKIIDAQKLLSLAYKLSRAEQKSVFSVAKIKLSRSIKSGIVQNIRCSHGDIVKPEDTLIEIDNKTGNTQRVTASINGFVIEVYTQIGKVIRSGEVIAQLLIVEKHYE